jgi:hypothetical protein
MSSDPIKEFESLLAASDYLFVLCQFLDPNATAFKQAAFPNTVARLPRPLVPILPCPYSRTCRADANPRRGARYSSHSHRPGDCK